MHTESPKQRSFWIWLIVIWFSGGATISLASFIAVKLGIVVLQEPQRSYFESMGFVDHASGILIAVINLLGAFYLFRLRKTSVYFFWCAFGLNVLLTVWHALSDGLAGAMSSSVLSITLGLGLLGAVCLYTQLLARRRMLH